MNIQLKIGSTSIAFDCETLLEIEAGVLRVYGALTPEIQAAIDLRYGTLQERTLWRNRARAAADLLDEIDDQFQPAAYAALDAGQRAEANRRAILAHNRILKRLIKQVGD